MVAKKENAPAQDTKDLTTFTDARAQHRSGKFARHFRVLGGLIFLTLSATLVAETHFCIGGDIDHLSPAALASCEARMADVRAAVRRQVAPTDWHFVVVCDEAGWKEYVSFSSGEAGLLSGAGYSTDPRLHWTFLHGSDLDQAQSIATVVSAALNTLPAQKIEPKPSSPPRLPQYSIAMAKRNSAKAIAQ